MNQNLTLVIMAAGMGSRFGGLKQIEPVGPNNEFIIDYSIYDAIKVGFKKIIFVIKEIIKKFSVFNSSKRFSIISHPAKFVKRKVSNKLDT